MSVSGRSNDDTARWKYFHSALQLAIQRSAHRWTYQDFTECFPLYTSEDKDGSMAVFQQISEFIETNSSRELEGLFAKYDVRNNINLLHRVLREAEERINRGEDPKDAWRDGLDPRAAIAARTIPKLEEETRQLRATLAQCEEDNNRLIEQLGRTVQATDEGDEKTRRLLQMFSSMLEQWKEVPDQEIEDWARNTIEETKPTLRS
ncbi:hypothetical protein CPB85DRAFT_1265090 [Mucidula mucida]|nr:hypothetical protein CPB85DRAFT_1265090 [Mucidula mucida]